MVTLFRDEFQLNSPEVQAKIERMQNDFPAEVKDLASSLLSLAVLAGIANTRILVASLLDRVEAIADIQQCPRRLQKTLIKSLLMLLLRKTRGSR